MDKSFETHVSALIDRLDALRRTDTSTVKTRDRSVPNRKHNPWLIRREIKTLELWRSVMCECLSTLFFVFLVCGSYVPWQGWSPTYVGVSLVTGFAAMTMTVCFGMVRNPSLTKFSRIQFSYFFSSYFLSFSFSGFGNAHEPSDHLGNVRVGEDHTPSGSSVRNCPVWRCNCWSSSHLCVSVKNHVFSEFISSRNQAAD